ncbi:MAG: PspC domain-containing protein [Actinomycetota bacterium]
MTQLGNGPPATEQRVEVTRLRRSRHDKVVAGVCGGLGAYFGVDPVWFRLAFVVLALGGGSGILVYLAAWLLIPPQSPGEVLAVREEGNGADGAMVVGAALVGVGLMLLFNTFIPWFDRIMWPLLVIVVGLGLLYTGRRRDS